MPKEIIESVRLELINNVDEKTKKSGPKFFKEEVKLYGVKTSTVTKIGKEFFRKIKDLPKANILQLCDTLWQSGILEESFIACNWSYYICDHYEPGDFQIFEGWLEKYVTNWASCDTLCNHTIGDFIDRNPQFITKLIEWSDSENRWVRRGAAVSIIIPARKGKFMPELFEIADRLLLDQDDLVQKGYGWMLKAASQADMEKVFEFVLQRKHKMPRTALRYAIEKMPQEMKKRAMAR